ncbi:MAG: sensor histidine kinase [Campylobacterales bacterium]
MRIDLYGERAVFVRMRAIHGAAIVILLANGFFFTDNPIGEWIQYILALIVLVHDIDEGKFAIGAFRQIHDKAKELAGLNATLEAQVAERTNELQTKNGDLTRALEDLRSATDQLVQTEKLAALGSLVAGMAHEVNTPLGIGVTAVSHLDEANRALRAQFEQGAMKKTDLERFLQTCSETVGIIFTNLNRAADLIQSFKKIAVDQSHESRHRFNMAEYLREIVVSLTPHLKKRPIQVEIDCPENISADTYAGAFSQVVTNLVTNSLAHAYDNDQRGVIKMSVTQRGDRLQLLYRDDGKGIAPEHLPKIFDPFFTTKRGQGGSGLGLNIIYNIVTKTLGGNIRAESEPGKGVLFTVDFPAVAAA